MIEREIMEGTVGGKDFKYAVIEERKGILVPLSSMRRIIGKRMAQSLQTAPQISVGIDAEMAKALELKDRLKSQNIKITVNDILVKSTALALLKNPLLNSTFTEQGVFILEEINIGVAVGVNNGLMVPVIRNADTLGLAELNKLTAELSEKARTGKLKIDEMSGGTFTISNSGVYGIDRCESIINPPEAGILAAAAIKKRPVVIEEKIKVAPLLPLTLTYDHRVLDGGAAAMFLQDVKKILENPEEFLLS